MNENQTKALKKAQTNKQEKAQLSEIFSLQTQQSATHAPTKADLLLLDFHYINYEFSKEENYSNEKTSTLLAIMDYLL